MSKRENKYSEKTNDGKYEYRSVMVGVGGVPRRLLKEQEWRAMGVQQSAGWEHFFLHQSEPNVLVFRRLLTIAEKDAQIKNP